MEEMKDFIAVNQFVDNNIQRCNRSFTKGGGSRCRLEIEE